MKKFNKILAMGFAAMMAVSAMSISAFAEETIPDFEYSSSSTASSILTDSKTRTSNEYNYEVSTYWTYYEGDNCPEAFTVSTIDQSVYKITAYIECLDSNAYVTTSATTSRTNKNACASETIKSPTEVCVYTSVGTFQATASEAIWQLENVQKLPA